MKKNILITTAAIVIALVMISCKKENINTDSTGAIANINPVNDHANLATSKTYFWAGAYGLGIPRKILLAQLKNNGSLRYYFDNADTTKAIKLDGVFHFTANQFFSTVHDTKTDEVYYINGSIDKLPIGNEFNSSGSSIRGSFIYPRQRSLVNFYLVLQAQ